MSVIGSNVLAGASGAAGAAGFQIERSLRFNDDDGANLSKTFSSAGNQKTWTWSGWIKRGNLGSVQWIYAARTSGSSNPYSYFYWNSDDSFTFIDQDSSGGRQLTFKSQRRFRDPSAWYHIVVVWDTTNSTEADRVKFYANGERFTDNQLTWVYPDSDDLSNINAAVPHGIGAEGNYATGYTLDGYLADVHFIDGQALAPTDFGELDDNNVWQPIEYAGTYGTNGFYLNFSDALGTDSSGNNNTWTVHNLTGSTTTATTLFNSDLKSTPFTDSSSNNLTLINNGSVTTTSAGTNSFNITNASNFVSSVASDQRIDVPSITIPTSFTIDYYYKTTSSTQPGNATIIDSNGEVFFRDYGTATSRTLRLFNGIYQDTAYTITQGTWYHIRISNSGIWVNGTLIQSSPLDITGRSSALSIGNYNGSTGYTPNALIGPIRFLNQDLGAPAAGGEPTTSGSLADSINVSIADGDVFIDTPTDYEASSGNNGGNYATLNPLDNGGLDLSNGNLTVSRATSSWRVCRAGIGITSGKHYWEYTLAATTDGSNSSCIGIAKSDAPLDNSYVGETASGWAFYSPNGQKLTSDSWSSYGSGMSNGDTIGVAFDADNGTLAFYQNGSSLGTAFTGLTSGPYFPAVSLYGTQTYHFNFGQRPFAISSVPTGYKSLCTTNLPDPTIADSSTAFETFLYEGDGASSRNLTLPLAADLVWIKKRNALGSHHLADTVRGDDAVLKSNSTAAEGNPQTEFTGGGISSISNTTVTLREGTSSNDNMNADDATFVGWLWDAGANSSKTYTVKVVSDSGNKYRFDDHGTSAVTLDLEEGSTYVFDQSDSSNSGHPLRFSTTSNGTHGGGSEYTTGVTTTGTPGSAGAKTTIVVASGASTLYYYCSNHSGMGGQANTNSTAGASNFAGSIQSTVRANASTGFSIVSFTTGSSTSGGATVGHGLNAAPGMYIYKPTSASGEWVVVHSYDYNNFGFLDLPTEFRSINSQGGGTTADPTSSVLTLYDLGVALASKTYVCYAFSPVEGYSAFGSYTANNSANGPFVFLGFRPAFVLIKCTTGAESWVIYDSVRGPNNFNGFYLTADSANAEPTSNTESLAIDMLSNGFKPRGTWGSINNTNTTDEYVYFAIAEHPFKTARAR